MTHPTTGLQTADLEAVSNQMAEILARQGIGRKIGNNGMLVPLFRQRIDNGSSYFLLELDTGPSSISGKVDANKLKRMDHTLTTFSGRHVVSANTVGITYVVEKDNQRRRSLPDAVMLSYEERPDEGNYLIPIGYDRKQGHLWLSLLDTSHILIGGESRSGKSTWLNALLAGLLPHHSPQELNVVFVDPKAVEFNIWDGIPHQIAPIAEDAETALPLLDALVLEMQERRGQFKEMRVRNLSQYNAGTAEPLPLILVVLDELTDLTEEDRRLYKPLIRLASKGAAFGILLVVATQNPNFEIVPTVIRSNLSTRIGFRVASASTSRVILGANVNGRGCHQIPRTKRGRFMLRYDADLIEMQGFLVSDEMAIQIADKLRQSHERAPQLDLAQARDEQDIGNDDVMYPVEPEPEGELELSEVEWKVLKVAVDELDGILSINPLYDKLKTQGVKFSRRSIPPLVEKLQTSGWLKERALPNEALRCGNTLIDQVVVYFGDE